MTEEEWLSGTDPRPMLGFLRGKVSDRKLRLFACACCHRFFQDRITDARTRECLAGVEAYADGCITKEELIRLRRKANQVRGNPKAHEAVQAVWFCSLHWTRIAAEHFMRIRGSRASRKVQRLLLQDVFGNPFRRVIPNSVRGTSRVVSLAQAAYADRVLPANTLDADRLAVLADALEDAGCTDAAILEHLRGPGPHVRGCWCVDLLLGKM